MENHIYLVFIFATFIASVWSVELNEKWRGDDIDDYTERPCDKHDMKCVRKFLATHSHCKMVQGPVPEPYYIKRLTIPLSNPNITIVLYDAKITGVNGKVTEFSINKKTNNLVIAAEMRDLTIYSPKAVFRYHRKMREPIVLADELYIKYDSITTTAVIPNINHLDISKIEVSSYIENSNPPYALGPGLIKSLDMDVIRSFNKLVSNIPEVIKEAAIFQGPIFMINFIQYSICDFGLKVIIP